MAKKWYGAMLIGATLVMGLMGGGVVMQPGMVPAYQMVADLIQPSRAEAFIVCPGAFCANQTDTGCVIDPGLMTGCDQEAHCSDLFDC